VGVVLDLGKVQQVGNVEVSFLGGNTSVELRTTEDSSFPQLPGGFTKAASGSGTKVSLKPVKPVQARYLLVWLTELPLSDDGNYRGKISDIKVTS
ncbi:serine/threonine protein kinase, partial [Streptomyces sp. wa22]